MDGSPRERGPASFQEGVFRFAPGCRSDPRMDDQCADPPSRGRAPREVNPLVAGTRSERSAPSALVRWMVRCLVLAGLLAAGWLIGNATALAGPLDPEVPLGTGGVSLPAPGLEAADQLDAVGAPGTSVGAPGSGGEAPAVLDTLTRSTGSAETVISVAERTPLPEVADLPEVAGTLTQIVPITQVAKPLISTVGSDETRPVAVNPPLTQNEPAPVSDLAPIPAPVTASTPPVLGPVAATAVPTAPAAEPAAAHTGRVQEGFPPSDPDGQRSTPPCSAGSSSGSGSASGAAAVSEADAGPVLATLGRKPVLTATIQPRGLPQRPSTSPD